MKSAKIHFGWRCYRIGNCVEIEDAMQKRRWLENDGHCSASVGSMQAAVRITRSRTGFVLLISVRCWVLGVDSRRNEHSVLGEKGMTE